MKIDAGTMRPDIGEQCDRLSLRGAAAAGFSGFGGPDVVRLDLGDFLEARHGTVEQLAVERALGFGERIVHPQARFACGDQARFSEMAKMSRNARLRYLKDVDNVAYAKLPAT